MEKQNFSTFSTAFSTGVVHTRFPQIYTSPVYINIFICLYKCKIFLSSCIFTTDCIFLAKFILDKLFCFFVIDITTQSTDI